MKKQRIEPIHPGAYLKEIIDELGITQYKLAKAIHVTAMRINHIIKGKRPVTAEMALRLGTFFGQTPRYWINLQSRYDLDCASESLGGEIQEAISPWEINSEKFKTTNKQKIA